MNRDGRDDELASKIRAGMACGFCDRVSLVVLVKRSPLPARTAPLKRTPIKRTVFEKRDVGGWFPIIARTSKPNVKRPGPSRLVSVVRDQGFMKWLKTEPCVACLVLIQRGAGITCYGHSDPCHTVGNGRSSKGPDSSCIPLGRYHHDEMDGRLNTKIVTKEQFAEKYGLDLAAIAAEHYARYKQEQGK